MEYLTKKQSFFPTPTALKQCCYCRSNDECLNFFYKVKHTVEIMLSVVAVDGVLSGFKKAEEEKNLHILI